MDNKPNPKQQLSERLKQANNVLVTVSNDPSVDQLAACIGLTLVLNHMGKHATAVFSGAVPSTIEFLKPETTLEKNTDSLRDFIIALDKSKADKLRYKVEDKVVKIFITPYRTSISQDDLQFSQGDFNVDVVVALGVHDQAQLDAAITEHGRILHDATVATINTASNGELGSINWVDASASSLSELVTVLASELDKTAFDNQTATALLTGIVAATDRFSNEKTTPATMSASAQLMSAGANQQLIATELAASAAPASSPGNASDGQGAQKADQNDPTKPKKEPGELDIEHSGSTEPAAEEPSENPEHPQVHIDEHGRLTTPPEAGTGSEEPLPEISKVRGVSETGKVTESNASQAAVAGEETANTPAAETRQRMTEPPEQGGELTANTTAHAEEQEPTTEALTLPQVDMPLLHHDQPADQPPPAPFSDQKQSSSANFDNQPASEDKIAPAITPDETLTDIEKSVHSPHALDQTDTAAPNVDDARSAVEAALNAGAVPPEVPKDFNALPLGPDLRDTTQPPVQPVVNTGFSEPAPGNTPADDALDMPLPPSNPFPSSPQMPGSSPFPPASSQRNDPNAPPPVPPPMLPPLQ